MAIRASRGRQCAALDLGVSAPRLCILRVVDRLVTHADHLDRIGLGKVLDSELAAHLGIVVRQVGERNVLADRQAVGDRGRIGTAA